MNPGRASLCLGLGKEAKDVSCRIGGVGGAGEAPARGS